MDNNNEWKSNINIKDGFDIVIGNPPYVIEKNFNLIKSYKFAESNNNLYTAFVESSLRLASYKGQVTLIIPNTWLSGNNFFKMRDLLLKNKQIKTIVQLPYDIFSVYIDTVVISLNKDGGNDYSKCFQFDFKIGFNNQVKTELIPIKVWIDDENKIIFTNKLLLDFIEKYKKNSVKLGVIAKVQRGTLPPSQDILHSFPIQNSIRWFDGQVYRYILTEKEKLVYVDYNILKENKDIELFNCKKLLARQLISRQFRLQLTLVETKFAFKKNLYAIYNLNSNYDYKYILAILNSLFYSFYYIVFNTSGQRNDYPSLSLNDFREFRIPAISLSEQKDFITLVDKVLLAKAKNPQTDTLILENQIDQMVYLLYNLTQEEIDIVEKNIMNNNNG